MDPNLNQQQAGPEGTSPYPSVNAPTNPVAYSVQGDMPAAGAPTPQPGIPYAPQTQQAPAAAPYSPPSAYPAGAYDPARAGIVNPSQQPALQQGIGAPSPQPAIPQNQGAAVVSGGGAAPKVKPVVAPANPNSTQNSLQIAEIRDGIVIMNDGSFRSVIMAKSINFDLMSPQEQEAVEYSYQGFLNSLYFPVQIFVRSQKVDLQPYLERLDKIRSEHDNMLLALLMEDYINYMAQLSQQPNIMDKKFYIIIPYFPHVDVQKAITQSKNFFTGLVGLFDKKEQHVVINEPDLEKAKTELRNRVQAVLAGLLQSSIQG